MKQGGLAGTLPRVSPTPSFGLKVVRFGSPDLRTGALGVKRVRGSVSPYSRGRAGPKKAHFGQNSKFDPRSTFRGDLFLRRSILKEGGVDASTSGFGPGFPLGRNSPPQYSPSPGGALALHGPIRRQIVPKSTIAKIMSTPLL